jgi:hypothetical protein
MLLVLIEFIVGLGAAAVALKLFSGKMNSFEARPRGYAYAFLTLAAMFGVSLVTAVVGEILGLPNILVMIPSGIFSWWWLMRRHDFTPITAIGTMIMLGVIGKVVSTAALLFGP